MRTPKLQLLNIAIVATVFLAIVGAYWWSNIPPKRPKSVSPHAVFLWAGHLGLPAPKHGTWIECWADVTDKMNKCRLTEMDGTVEYEGEFLPDTGGSKLFPQHELDILSEQTSQSTSLWVRTDNHFLPLVFLKDGVVLIPKNAYQEGVANLRHLRHLQGQ